VRPEAGCLQSGEGRRGDAAKGDPATGRRGERATRREGDAAKEFLAQKKEIAGEYPEEQDTWRTATALFLFVLFVSSWCVSLFSIPMWKL
jgi:hypothetical protein